MWAIEFAEEHPKTEVTGVDLSPVQPAFVPQNCQFIVDDIEYDWAYEKQFDFVHGRFLSMGIRDLEPRVPANVRTAETRRMGRVSRSGDGLLTRARFAETQPGDGGAE